MPAMDTGAPPSFERREKRNAVSCSTRLVLPGFRLNSGPDAGTEPAMYCLPCRSATIQSISTERTCREERLRTSIRGLRASLPAISAHPSTGSTGSSGKRRNAKRALCSPTAAEATARPRETCTSRRGRSAWRFKLSSMACFSPSTPCAARNSPQAPAPRSRRPRMVNSRPGRPRNHERRPAIKGSGRCSD